MLLSFSGFAAVVGVGVAAAASAAVVVVVACGCGCGCLGFGLHCFLFPRRLLLWHPTAKTGLLSFRRLGYQYPHRRRNSRLPLLLLLLPRRLGYQG